jgi:GWxTD domain-containing protein
VLPPESRISLGVTALSTLDAAPTSEITTAAAEGLARNGAAELVAAPPVTEGPHWRFWLLGLYLAGAVAGLTRLAAGTVRTNALSRQARMVAGQLTSTRIATPFTVGLLRAKILLPSGWDRWPAARLAAVLEHERAHVRRRDPLVLWLALLNRALFWFHPLAWWLERRLAALAEEACDAAVLARGCTPIDYSEHLLNIARLSRRPVMTHAVGMPMPGSALPARIANILEGKVAGPSSRTAVAGTAALATVAAAVLGTVTLAQDVDSPSLVPSADRFTPLSEYWHDDDEWRLEVAPLMTPEEADAYRSLRSFEERDRFIAAFWQRRDPTPGTLHNERRKEYERRIHYAQEHFGDRRNPEGFGYQTTPGTVYVLFGQPDSIERLVENGREYEYWHYTSVNDTGQAYTVRLARWPNWGCGPAYDIVDGAPSGVFDGPAWLGTGAARPFTIRAYDLGLVTISIPIDYATMRSVRLKTDRGTVFDGLPAAKPPPGKPDTFALYRQAEIVCTVRTPPGAHRLTAEADLLSGATVAASVAFAVPGGESGTGN